MSVIVLDLNHVKLHFCSPLTPLPRNDQHGGFRINLTD